MTEQIKIISVKEFLKNNKKPNQEEVWDSISDLWSEYKKKPFFTVEEFLKNLELETPHNTHSKPL